MTDDIHARCSDPKERDNLVYGISRWLSKTGDLSRYKEELSVLAAFLDPDEVKGLYTLLASERLELEWRDQFIEYFAGSEEYLPEMAVTEESFAAALSEGRLHLKREGEGERGRREEKGTLFFSLSPSPPRHGVGDTVFLISHPKHPQR